VLPAALDSKNRDATRGGMSSHGENAVLRAQPKEATLWLSIAESNEERVYLREMQVLLGDLQRLLDRSEILHRIKSQGASGELPLPSEQPQWNENVIAFISAHRGARDVRGCAFGTHLNRLAARLEEQIGQSMRALTDRKLDDSAISHGHNRNRSFKDIKSGSARAARGNERQTFLRPILEGKGFSVHDWAKTAGVDFHTANDYLNGETTPYKSTRKKLADAIGIGVERLPA